MRLLSILVLAAVGVVGLMPEPAQAQLFCRGRRAYGGYYGSYYGGPGNYGPRYSTTGYASTNYFPEANYTPTTAYYTPGTGYGPRVAGYYAPPADQQALANQQSLARIELRDNAFEPKSLNIQAGATVQFVNAGQMPHTVTSDDGRWESGDIPPGGVFNAMFIYPGTYRFHCKYHSVDKMVGSITVAEAAPPSAQPGTSPPTKPGERAPVPPSKLPSGKYN
jgi:plastocyanin